MGKVKGGTYNCQKSGDTIFSDKGITLKMCVTYESSCQVKFSSHCNSSTDFTGTCGNFVIYPPK